MTVTASFFCKDAFLGASGDWSISDICDHVVVPQLPANLQGLTYFASVALDTAEALASHEIEFTMTGPDGAETGGCERQAVRVVKFPSHGKIILRVKFLVSISKPGCQLLRLSIDGVHCHTTPFWVYIDKPSD